MDKNIKIYKPLVWAKVEFGFDREVLYWEGKVEDFREKKSNLDYIIFDKHNNRHVPTSKIKDFAQVENNDIEHNLEFKLVSATETQKLSIKSKISNIKKNLGREATEKEIDRIILITVNPQILEKEKLIEMKKNAPLSNIQRFKTGLIIKKQKIAKIITGNLFGFKP